MKNTVIIIATTFFFACKTNSEERSDSIAVENNILTLTEEQYRNANLKTEAPVHRPIYTTLKLNGKIDVPPQNMISVSTPLGGFLRSSKLLPGMLVKKGEIIATMEDQQYIQLQQEYLTTRSKLVYLEKEYDRQKELNQSKASSDKLLQQTEMDYKTQKIALNALSEKLRLINIEPASLNETTLSRTINIYSTINGFVSSVNVNIGKYVSATEVLFELIDPEDIHLNLKVFEKDLSKLSIGQKISAYNNNDPDKKHSCEIILIGQDLSNDRTAEVHCHFSNYDKTLVPGMYMNAEVKISTQNSLSINSDAIVSFDGKEFVFVSKGNRSFELTEIITGNSENNYTEIVSKTGKSLEDLTIVSKGAYVLLMQLKNRGE